MTGTGVYDGSDAVVPEMIKWSGNANVIFHMKADEIRGFRDLSISAKPETENKTADGETYIKKKNKGNIEISLTAILSASLGTDVRKVARAMVNAARAGKSGYFYMSGEKLFTCKFMATSAEISNIRLTRAGTWLYAEVAFTLQQCSKYGSGSSSSSSSGSSSSGSSSGSSSSETRKKYTVQIPGMNSVTVWATSVQSAIRQAGGKSWTGSIMVNGKMYEVSKGTLITKKTDSGSSTSSSSSSSKSSSSGSTASKAAEAAKKAIDTITAKAKEVISTINKAKAASSSVTKDANSKTTTTKNTSVVKPAGRGTITPN